MEQHSIKFDYKKTFKLSNYLKLVNVNYLLVGKNLITILNSFFFAIVPLNLINYANLVDED